MHPLKLRWILLLPVERRVVQMSGAVLAAAVVTLATLALGIGVLTWLAGAYSAMAVEGLTQAVLAAFRPSTRHERKLARRVLRAIGHPCGHPDAHLEAEVAT